MRVLRLNLVSYICRIRKAEKLVRAKRIIRIRLFFKIFKESIRHTFNLHYLLCYRDDVCVLSVTGTAAIINLLFTTGEIGLLNTTLVTTTKTLTTSTKDTMNVDVEKDQSKSSNKGAGIKETIAVSSSSNSTAGSNIATVPVVVSSKGEIEPDVTIPSVTNKENNQNTVNASLPPSTTSKTASGNKPVQPDCAVCHIPYSRSSMPFNVHMKKCAICK